MILRYSTGQNSDPMYATIVLEIQEQLGQVMIMFLQESQYCSLLLYVLDYLLYYLGDWSSHLVWFLVLNQTELIVVLPVPLSPRCSLNCSNIIKLWLTCTCNFFIQFLLEANRCFMNEWCAVEGLYNNHSGC